MGVPIFLQLSIAVSTGMVAATFAPPVRRAIPRWVEVLLWMALIASCVLGVISIHDPHARELTATLVWGVDRLLNTVAGLLAAGALAWVHAWLLDHRLAIADAMVLALGADLLALALLRSWRNGRAWQPRVWLREWMELPPLVVAAPQPAQAYVFDDLNRRWAAAVARAAAAGRVEVRERLDSLGHLAAQVQFAAVSWYTTAGAPAIESLSARAAEAVMQAATARRGRRLAGFGPDQVMDIQALVRGQTTHWYSPMPSALPAPASDDEDGFQHSERLAS